MVNVPPSRSAACSLPSRARATRSARAAAISATVRALAARDDRHEQAAVGGDGDTDVRGRMQLDGVARVERVDGPVAHQRGGADLGEHIGHGRALLRVPLDQARAQLLRAGHVRGHDDLESGRRPRLGHPPPDRPAQRGQLDALDLARPGRRCRRPLRPGDVRPLDVLGDDAALGPSAGQGREVDAALAGDPAGERRRLDPPVRRDRPIRPLRSSLRLPGVCPCRNRRGFRYHGRRCSRLDLLLRRPDLRHVLPLLAQERHRRPDRHLALVDEDLQEDAADVGLHLLRDLVGVELVQRLALLHLIALRLQPADDRPRLHALAEPGQRDLLSHRVAPSSGSPPARRRRPGRRSSP